MACCASFFLISGHLVLFTGPIHGAIFLLQLGVRLIKNKLVCVCFGPQLDHDLKHAHELRQAAFKLYASLGSNDEDIRKKVRGFSQRLSEGTRF